MNTLKTITMLVMAGMFGAFVSPNEPISKIRTITFKVEGLCGMCKDRIESITQEKGVRYAEWNMDTKVLKLSYSTKKTDEATIRSAIAERGHDNDPYFASDSAYNQLHHCCKYRGKTNCDGK